MESAGDARASCDDGSSGIEVEVEAQKVKEEQEHQQQELQLQEQQQLQQQGEMLEVTVKCEQEESEEMNKEVQVGICHGDAAKDKEEKTLLTYRRRSQAHQQLVTPKAETVSPRPVRATRGIKRRFPGDESDEGDVRRPARVRSMTEVFAESARYNTTTQSEHSSGKVIGENGQRGARRLRAKKRGRQSRGRKVIMRGVNGSDYSDENQGNVYVCNHEGCDKVFSEPGALYRHARVHGDRPYVCHYEGCNRRFLERSKLKRHYLIHTGEKSFICGFEGCGKAFSLDFNLRSHMKTHTGDYHECPHEGCEKKYCQNYKLRAHMCKDHNQVEGNDALVEAMKESAEMKAAKKQEKLQQLVQRKERLGKWRDGRRKRIHELEVELERESKELGKLDKALKKLDRERNQLEVDESELSSSDDLMEPEIDEQAVMCEDREVLVFAQQAPTADQGARLVQGDPRMVSSDVLVSSRPLTEFSPLTRSNVEGGTTTTTTTTTTSSSSNAAKVEVEKWGQGWDSHSSHSKLLLLQQSELPVAHLFSFQEQPCLVD